MLVAGPAPWNPETRYEGNTIGDWVQYFADTLRELPARECDGFAVHTYTHRLNTGQIKDEFFHGAQGYQHLHNEFLTYRDFMQAIPERFRRLPVFITETDPTEPGVGWEDGQNVGWVIAAYDEIARWNMEARNQPIQALILYRWPQMADQPEWSIEDRPGIQDDFGPRCALNPASRYQVRLPSQAPALETPSDLPDVSLPSAFTNQHVIDAFHDAAAALGLADRWTLLKKVQGLSLGELAKDRQKLYTGPDLAQLPGSRNRNGAWCTGSWSKQSGGHPSQASALASSRPPGVASSKSDRATSHPVGSASCSPHQLRRRWEHGRAPRHPDLEPLGLVSPAPGRCAWARPGPGRGDRSCRTYPCWHQSGWPDACALREPRVLPEVGNEQSNGFAEHFQFDRVPLAEAPVAFCPGHALARSAPQPG